VVLAAMEAVVKHGGEVLGDATHAPRADRLDAGLLNSLEYSTRLLTAGHKLAMHRRIVTGEPQRHRVGVAAHDRSLALVETARRLRQPRLAAGEARALGSKRDLDVVLAGNRPQANTDGALERLSRRFLGRGFGLDVRTHMPRRCCKPAQSLLNSAPH